LAKSRALNLIKKAAIRTYVFVGSALDEAKIADSVSGKLLAI